MRAASAMMPWRMWMALVVLIGVGCGDSATAPSALPSSFRGQVVFVRAEGGGNTLMVMHPDGTGVRSLGIAGLKPDVAPDGKRVAYQRNQNLYVFDLSTGRETRIASTGINIAASWSPDGTRVLFWSDRSGAKDLWVVNADGSNPVRITDGTSEYLEADWSPDGSRIICRRNTGDGGDLWVMNADGSHQTVLSSRPGQEGNPQWSPDGTHIAFDWVEGSGASASVGVYVMNADGSNAVRVSVAGVESWAPRWSPDSRQVAFFAYPNDPNDADIFTVRPDGTGLTPLLADSTYDHEPTYGPAQ